MTSILSGLDYYKLTMSQQAWRVNRNAEVTFTLKNRNPKQRLMDRVSVEQLQDALSVFGSFSLADITYLGTLDIFDETYLQYIYQNVLPRPHVTMQENDLHVEVTGPWPLVTFWETIIMSTINDLYFVGRDARYYTIGQHTLTDSIRALQDYPEIRVADFGTRRRFGLNWQRMVVERMVMELPKQFIGTSNPYFAREFGIRPIGTFAHEMPMVYAGLADLSGATNPLDSHSAMLDDWFHTYGTNLSIALTDTFGSDFFFKTFGEDRAILWNGLRHDSGDPEDFGFRAIEYYESLGIDPMTKTVVFSDGLNLRKILDLHETFQDKIGHSFGWGTGLTNNVGLKPLNIVMKATHVNGQATVKLSDDPGKHTGDAATIARYLAAKKELM